MCDASAVGLMSGTVCALMVAAKRVQTRADFIERRVERYDPRALARPPSNLPAWLVICASALPIHLGSIPLNDADERRNGEVGREMAATNDYVMPRIDGMPDIDKPIVYLSAGASGREVLGTPALAARLPAYLFTLFSAALIFWFARRVWGEDEGLIAAIAYLAMPLTLAFSRT